MKQIQIRKDHLVQLRALVLDRLQDRRNTIEPIHVDRVFAELLGEPLPRTSARERNGHVPDPGVDPAAFNDLVARQDRFETITTEMLTQVHRAMVSLVSLFETRPAIGRRPVGRPRNVTLVAPALPGKRAYTSHVTRKQQAAAALRLVRQTRKNKAKGLTGIRHFKTMWQVNIVRGGKFQAKRFPLDTPMWKLRQAREQLLTDYYAKHPNEKRQQRAAAPAAAPTKKPRKPYVHWTQKPENKERVQQAVRRAAAARNAK